MFLSFIIPVYNVERYLSVCLNSILTQGLALTDYEIILIEDRSTDNSLQICRDYLSKYNHIKLIENERNLGPGLSRNKGLFISKGDFLFFMDSDDCLFPNALNSIISMNVLSPSHDIIQFEASNNPNNTTGSCNEILYKGSIIDCPFVFKNLAAWSFLFRREYIINNNFSFTNSKIGEDALFIITTLKKTPSVVIISNLVYYYRYNPESISNNTDISYIYCQFEIADKIQSILSKSKISVKYVSLILKGIVSKFYKKPRSLQECIRFKRKMETFKQYDTIIAQGKWYIQLVRIPLLLYCYLVIKKRQ